MNTNDIITFLTVYESKSINYAANELYISPQGLTKIIKRIENELGTTLFLRSSQGISATPEAKLFYSRMKLLISEYKSVLYDIHEIGHKHLLRTCFTSGILSYLTLDYMEEYTNQHPDIELLFEESPDAIIQAKILSKECDIGIMSGPIHDERLSSSLFTQIPMLAVVAKEHPLAAKEKLTFSDLDGQKLALITHRSKTHAQFLRRLASVNATPSAIYEAEQLLYTHKYAAYNGCVGQTYLSECYLFNFPNTVIIPFEDPSFTWNSYFVWSATLPLNEVTREFVRFTYDWKVSHGLT